MLITKNWCKRFLALACALVCVFVLSIPSFAEVSNLTYDECVSRYSDRKSTRLNSSHMA